MDSSDLKMLLAAIGIPILILGGILYCCIKADEAYEHECAVRGGHVVSKAAYKSSVTFCISDDGRILE